MVCDALQEFFRDSRRCTMQEEAYSGANAQELGTEMAQVSSVIMPADFDNAVVSMSSQVPRLFPVKYHVFGMVLKLGQWEFMIFMRKWSYTKAHKAACGDTSNQAVRETPASTDQRIEHVKRQPKITVEDCLALDVRELASAGYLEPGRQDGIIRFRRGDREIGRLGLSTGPGSLHLEYDVAVTQGSATRLGYDVAIVLRPAIKTAERMWFSCPGCLKPVGKLYLPPGKTAFLCRTCHNLTYSSRQKRGMIGNKLRELPQLEEDLKNPRLGLERRLKALQKIEKLSAEVEGQFTGLRNRFLPELVPTLPGQQNDEPGAMSIPSEDASVSRSKRSRGRPIVKRAYKRRKPFHGSIRRTDAEAFCVKCRDYCEPRDLALLTFRNGRPALQGICPSCGSKVARIITADEAAVLLSATSQYGTGGARG